MDPKVLIGLSICERVGRRSMQTYYGFRYEWRQTLWDHRMPTTRRHMHRMSLFGNELSQPRICATHTPNRA